MIEIRDRDDITQISNDTIELTWDINELPVPGDIPDSVKDLTFDIYFDQKLWKCHIPNSVIHLTSGESTDGDYGDDIINGDMDGVHYMEMIMYHSYRQSPLENNAVLVPAIHKKNDN